MESYKKLLEERRTWYKSIKKVYCPILKEWIGTGNITFLSVMKIQNKKKP